ncbi:e85d2ebb-f424-4bfe-8b71-f91d1f156dd3 [Thermothielavioides terrestris]|uniref:E85d2ebb-f424-4bfe-8b71-f91d1f156dd3 n=1 Tax=Thermothielavioides terrestris TaxID=2587410 RepID=A0A446BBW9_9PEZI|nr:e85d2ebb-f424-4bfe-8b71-f91d1f156dd3 [Thermothielavioides terrestris]
MAVSNKLYHETEDLVLTNPRRRFRTSIRWQHWQLRSLIGVDGQNAVYFPVQGPDSRSSYVQRLNTKTRETEIIKRLSFNPRCLVARNGWVCCGGELGIFSAFRVGEETTADDAGRRLGLQADDRLPLTLDLSDANSALLAQARSEKNLVAQSNAFGKDRVNCITLWFPPTLVEPCEGAYDQDVAVLAHNDSSVMVVSLRDQEVLDKITYPDYMNRGVVSPDGRLLIAISDDPYLGSFAACFSSTGRYLAVGTQYGTISIFDAAALGVPGVDPLLLAFNTTRPNAEFGAVRDMAFAPGPVDLLAWTEDRGRVGVADIRTGFDSRQILYLDRDDDFEHLSVTDRSTIDPRLLEQRGDRGESLLSSFANALDTSLESRQNRHSDGQGPLARYNIPLTAEETAVLEAIQDYRRRQDQYNAGPASNRTDTESSGTSNGNGNGNGGGAGGSSAASRAPWAERAARTVESSRTRERTASVSRAVNEMLDNIRDQRERIRDAQDRLRAREDSSAERRRYAASPFSGSTSALGTAGSGTSGRGSLISRLLSNANPPSSGGWDNVEALAAYIMRDWEENPGRRVFGTFVTSHSRPGAYDTAGLAWSENGDTLFVGAETGVYEFRVNLFGRRLSPSITLS